MRFGQVAHVDDRGVVGNEFLEEGDVPWRLHGEKFDHVSLQVPHNYLTFLVVVIVLFRILRIAVVILLGAVLGRDSIGIVSFETVISTFCRFEC